MKEIDGAHFYMANNFDNKSKRFMRFLILGISLSTAGSTMSLLSISTLLFNIDSSGSYSAWLQIIILLGVVLTGVFGGSLISHMTPRNLGFLMPGLSAVVLFFLLMVGIEFQTGVIAIFILSCLYGVEHPNNIRTLNQMVAPEKKASIFSFYQTVTQLMTMCSPMLAGFIIAHFNAKLCIIIDIITCLLSAIIWLLFSSNVKLDKNSASNTKSWYGYQLLFKNKAIRDLNISRIINNISYVTFVVGLPIFIAGLAHSDTVYFAKLQGYTGSATACAFAMTGLCGTALLKKYPKDIKILTFLASLLGFSAVVLGYYATSSQSLIVAAAILGVGQFCFRIFEQCSCNGYPLQKTQCITSHVLLIQ